MKKIYFLSCLSEFQISIKSIRRIHFKTISFSFLQLIILFGSVNTIYAQCNFNVSDNNPCGNTAVTFTVNNPSGTYGWDFDADGNIDAYGIIVNYTFPQSNSDLSYTVSLYRDNVFCESEIIIVRASPNPMLGVVPGNAIQEDDLIRLCSPTPDATLQVINNSTSQIIDAIYYINWGDGSIDTFDINEFGPTGFVEHDYFNYGYYNLTFTAIANNGCEETAVYTFYNGSNPSVGLANPGNTVGLCAPATLEFPITNYQNNPTGTEYFVYVGGELVQSYTQANVPASFTYTFEETSCGLTTSTGNYSNAFDVQVEAVNPCGSSQATIEPIEVSTPPELEFDSSVPQIGCIEDPITVTNASANINEVISGNPSICESSITPSWNISPGTQGIDWTIISGNIFGSDAIEIIFHIAGVYSITMTVHSPSCGPATYSESFTIIENPTAGATFELDNGAVPNINSECAPTVGTFTNTSTGDSLEFNWQVSPATGWNFGNGFTANDEHIEIVFNEAGTYTVGLNTMNPCATAQWDTTFVIAEAPIITLEDFPPFCESGTLNINPSDVSYDENGGTISSYSWSFPGANPNNSSDQYPTGIFYDTPGSYVISLTVENQCGATTVNGTLEVEAPGNLIIDNDYTVCENEPAFTLFADPAGGVWSGNGVSIDGLFTPGPGNIGQNTITYTFGSGACTQSDDLVVTVLPKPVVTAGENESACESDDPFILTGYAPTGGNWTVDNGGVLSGNNAFDPAASGPGVYTLTYAYTDNNGCEDEATKTIIVYANPAVEAGPDLSVCENPNDLQLSGFTPAGGIWSGTGVTPTGIFNVQNTPGQGTYTLYYDFENPNTNCSARDSLMIVVVANDTAQAGPNVNLCITDDILILDDGIPSGGSWTGPGVNTNGGFFDPQIAGIGNHTLTYTYGSGICETEDFKLINVHDLPMINLPPDQAVCINNPAIDLSAASPSGGNWSGPGINGNLFDPMTAGLGTHFLTYHYVNLFTGCENVDTMQMEVVPIPLIQVQDSSYCDQPGAVQLPMATPVGGIWSGPGMVGSNSFDPTLAGGAGSYVFNYSFTNYDGCSHSENINITIIAPAVIDAGPNDSLCVDEGQLILNNFTPAGGYWSGPGIADSTQAIFDPALAGQGSHTIYYVYGSGNCQVVDQKIIYVIDLTGVGVGADEEFCEFDDPVELQASGPDGGSWNGPGIIDFDLGIFDPQVAGPGTHTVTYQYTDPSIGCTASADKEITIHPQTPADFTMNEVSCVNQSVQFLNLSDVNHQSFWDLGNGTTSIERNPLLVYDSAGTYTVSLVTTNAFGCRDTAEQFILITETANPAYELNTYFGCAPLEVDIANQSIGYDVSFNWDFGNGNTSTDLDPPTQLYQPGLNDTTYYITLNATNLCGTISIVDSVTVRPLPNAAFAFYPEEPCSPMTVNFGNVSTGSVENFYWNFGNGNFSTDTLPESQIYVTDTSVIYVDVTLIATNICGADTAIQTIEVTPPDVQAFFTVSENRGCAPLTVDFSNYATPGANVDWIFGDGNSSIELNPVHTFDTAGIYTVIQFASSECGYDTTAVEIEVLPIPQVSFDNNSYVCLGSPITFTNTSEGISGAEWDFGDGTGSTLNSPQHVYSEPGIYTITLTGYSQFNQCPAYYTGEVIVQGLPVASFVPGDQSGCAPYNASFSNNSINAAYYVWNFGDGNTSVEENPFHLYEDIGIYEVELIATDTYGCSNDTSILNIIVHPTPIADFAYDYTSQCSLPANFEFENLSEGAAGFNWDFGDGQTAAGNNPAHTYFEEGDYEVQLIANNQFNCADTIIQPIQVLAPPTADFDAQNFQGCSPLTVEFENSGTYGNNFYWVFGDGQTSTEEDPTVTFTAEGFHGVQLVLSNNDVCFDTVTVTSMVQVHPEVIASFEAQPADENLASGNYEFINTSTGAEDYFWEFNDGQTSTEISPTHRFSTNGAIQVYLEASNQFGCVDDTLLSLTPNFIKGLHIPNGFSPAQGIGDVRLFKPAGIGLKEYRIQVFSPYGQLLWESTKLTDKGEPAEGWNGYHNGDLLPQDVYVWKAFGMFGDGSVWPGEKKENGKYQAMGSVILLR